MKYEPHTVTAEMPPVYDDGSAIPRVDDNDSSNQSTPQSATQESIEYQASDIEMYPDDIIQMNALGDGQINVCGENGDIEVGDLIVTSNTPGKGMKQSDGFIQNFTVAKAREAVTFSSPDEVKQIVCIYMCG
jgi:hypothetical protein